MVKPQAAAGVELPASAFDEVFPFHFAFGPDWSVLRRGRSLARVCPRVVPGSKFDQLFEPVRPEAPFAFEDIVQAGRTLFLVKEVATGVVLRGQMLSLRPAQDVVVFLGSPWLPEPAAIAQHGLSFEDFAVHDPALDLLQVLQSQKMAVADLKKLAAKLQSQRAALREANEKLRQKETEYRKLALIAARTDNAVVLTDSQGLTEWVNEGFTRLTGYEVEEVRGKKPGAVLQGPATDAETVRRIAERLRQGEGFSEEILNYAKDGRSYWLAIEVQPIRDDDGRITNFMAIETDITARRAAQQRLAIQFGVSSLLAQADNLAVAVPRLLQTICENLSWQVGQFWQVEANRLRFLDAWHSSSANVADFARASRGTEFTRGVGLPGRVWATGQPVWIPDVTRDASFPRREVAAEEGLHGAFAFPVMVHGELWGVAEFFSRRIEEPDDSLLITFASVGNQIGQFVVRREAEDTLHRTNTLQRAILEGANYSIISTAPDGIIQTFNSAAERLLGYGSEEVVGKVTPAMIHDLEEVKARAEQLTRELGRKVEAGFEAFVAKAALGRPDEREWTYIRKDGSRFPVLLSVTALFGERGEVTGYLGVASDITERKRAAIELVNAKEAAEAANRAKSDFLAMMSHEIRTPMNAVLGMTNLLLDTPLDSKQTELAGTVARSGEALIEIINDILDFSKIEAGEHFQLEEEVFSLRQLVDEVVQLLRPRAKAKGLSLNAELIAGIPDGLRSDDGRLRQVLVNLVGNGLKFTEKGGVKIRVQGVMSSADKVLLRFEVEDTGIGMATSDLALLFQPFTQVGSSSSRRRGGTGLGLAISKRIVELIGGRIGVISTPGKGSLFWFELPLPVSKTPLAGAAVGSGAARGSAGLFVNSAGSITDDRPLRILVVEDQDTNRRLATLMLESLGHRADFANNGLDAVEAWERLDPDVILMDCQMPEMDGFEATREIRRRETGRELRPEERVHIIALTANALKGDRERCLAAGMDGYLSKPFSLERLRDALENRPSKSELALSDTTRLRLTASTGFDPRQPAQLCAELGDNGVMAIIRDFLKDLPERTAELKTLADAGSFQELARLAHALQGIGRTLGLNGFSDELLHVERAAAARDHESVARSMQSLLVKTEPGVVALRGWLATRRS